MTFQGKMPLQAKTLHPVLRNQGVLAGKVTFGEAEVMNGVQQVGFTPSVAPANPDQGGGKAKLLVEVVFELEN